VRTNAPESRPGRKIWRRKSTIRLFSFIRNGATVIDIGGNIGVFSVKAALLKEGVRVFAYEPVPGMWRFQENVALNRLGAA